MYLLCACRSWTLRGDSYEHLSGPRTAFIRRSGATQNTDHMTASRLRLTSARLSEESSSCDHSEFVKGSWAAHPVARAFVLTFIRDICSPLFCASCDMLGRCGMIAQPWPFLCTLQATALPQVLLCTNISWKILFEGVKSLLSTLRQRWSD